LRWQARDTKNNIQNILKTSCYPRPPCEQGEAGGFVVKYKSRISVIGKDMANDYLIDIHNYISKKIVYAESLKAEAQERNDAASLKFYEGQLAEWQQIRAYLTEKVDLKTQKYF
jgi:hypothetical protein